MAIFAVRMFDAEDGELARDTHRAAHLAYVETIRDRILVAGPLASQQADVYDGSLAVLQVADRRELEAIINDDPYYRGGAWERYEVQVFEPLMGAWVDGGTSGM
jgi:uncharacterized protein YciI